MQMRFGSSCSCCFCRAEHMAVSGGIRETVSGPAVPICAHPRSPGQFWAFQTSCITLSLQPCHQLGMNSRKRFYFHSDFSCCCFLRGRWKRNWCKAVVRWVSLYKQKCWAHQMGCSRSASEAGELPGWSHHRTVKPVLSGCWHGDLHISFSSPQSPFKCRFI